MGFQKFRKVAGIVYGWSLGSRSQTTLTRFCTLLTPYPPLIATRENLHTIDISSTTYLLVNVVCECLLNFLYRMKKGMITLRKYW